MTKIEFLYFLDCPNYLPALDLLRRVLKEENLEGQIDLICVGSQEMAEKVRFLGSPSIRIGKKDLEEEDIINEDFGMKCRVYQVNGKPQGFPSEKLIRDGIQRTKAKNP